MTTKTTAAEVAEPLEAGFPPSTDREDQWLAETLFRLLAKGEPVDTARLAAAVARPEPDVSAALAGPTFDPLVYRDDRGRITGFSGLGIAELGETVHRLKLDDGHEVYAWCAGDSLFLPIALGAEVRVESRCPVTGETIGFLGSPSGFRDLEPPEAVMSMLSPEEVGARLERGEDVIRSLCHWIYFFASEEAAREWTSERPGTTTFPIDEGFELGRRWMAHKWGISSKA
jgi:alkylmercury lyase